MKKAHDYKEVHAMLGINLSKLGCIMLDTEPIPLDATHWDYSVMDGQIVTYKYDLEMEAYFAKDKTRFWIDGYVGDKTPHLTLMYGFLNEAENYKKHIEILLADWGMDIVKIANIGYFNSPYDDEEYYCIVAHIEKTPELLDGNGRMSFLPHINTFPDYSPHITIAYIKKNDIFRDDIVKKLKSVLIGKELKVTGLNYGGNK